MLAKIFSPIISSSPRLKRTVWRSWYEFLARGYTQSDWTFMNYGYAEGDGDTLPRPISLQADDEADRCSIQLYQRVVGNVDLRGRTVLEVGSGRGGGSSFVARYHDPKSVLGIDYSDNAVTLSQKRHKGIQNLDFRQGDAESLPCVDDAFDAVINVESSHCYGSMERFLSEVVRVLKPGGHFLWADMRLPQQRDTLLGQFNDAGFEIVEETNIAPNVVLALQRVQHTKRDTIQRYVPRFLRGYVEDFSGVPGTRVYESLREGKVEYWRFALRKPM